MEILVITVSDRAYRGEYEDLSGPKIREIIENSDVEARVELMVVPDEQEKIREAFLNNLDKDYILTTGGTGLSPRDVTPEVTQEVCERALPGISEMLRFESYRETKFAVLSRGYAGVRGKTIIINFPGSVKAVGLCTYLILPLLDHAQKMLRGEGH
ncbi:MAG: MogA/MoaB family molybdenum cofactor biosynthesis protein [Candidatus Aminicenantes bacterium]|nr:MAG: MogA/MoaB family molybdenum cofactor biosynthesis protein [Candidatus Aminicenantes bacterium]